MTQTSPQRNDDGTFPAGVSGNPAGRPLGKKSEITDIQQSLELAIRKNFDQKRIGNIIEALIQKAEGGSLQAARLLLDKILPNAKAVDDGENAPSAIIIRIKNATIGANNPPPGETYEGEVVTSLTIEEKVNE